jgi:hypothetical protein
METVVMRPHPPSCDKFSHDGGWGCENLDHARQRRATSTRVSSDNGGIHTWTTRVRDAQLVQGSVE